MMAALIVSPEAQDDVNQAFRWYEEQLPGLGRRFLHYVDEAFQRISKSPELHAVVHKQVRQTLVK